jgi:ABC-2 type transport system ATP-binding protein
MIQRVGLAQAIINDPEVVFLDEPMSGLDPLGRREVRQLILRLRDEGRTVFFSSHILADAEALCSRIAIVAKGRLMATGALTDILAVRMLGWEIVVDGLATTPETARLGFTIQKVTKIDEQRYALEVAPHVKPEDAIAQVIGRSGRLVSVNPIRETLEDFFVRQVADAGNPSRFLDQQKPGKPRSAPERADDDTPQAAAGGR